jgi:hypothetical protein
MAVVAGRWAANYNAYLPFTTGYFLRLLVAAAATLFVQAYPDTHATHDSLSVTASAAGGGGDDDGGASAVLAGALGGGEGGAEWGASGAHYMALVAIGLAMPAVGTLCFTALGSFSNAISDPEMVCSVWWCVCV